MKYWLLLLLLPVSSWLSAQNLTGVWRGVLVIGSNPNGNTVSFKPVAPLDPITGYPIRRAEDVFPAYEVLVRTDARSTPNAPATPVAITQLFRRDWMDSSKINTLAKLEILDIEGRLMAQLTSYGADNRQITVYEFTGMKKGENSYSFKGSTALVNETEGEAPAFDLEGKTADSSGISFFEGKWRGQMSRSLLGNFHFVKVAEPFTLNPELVHRFINPKNDPELTVKENDWLTPSTPVYDSLATTGFFVDGSIIDNGIADHDTLSIWLNGQLLEDNIIPSKKRTLFHASLSSQEWNYLTIRCKSEGSIRGVGLLLNMRMGEQLLKYQLVMYRNDQVDWVIRKKETRKQLRPDQ